MDTGGAAAAQPWVERAAPDFPVLVDAAHDLGRLFGVVNVPTGIWVDEDGVLVRPPETAYPARPAFAALDLDDPAVTARFTDPEVARFRMVTPLVRQMRIEPERYVAALRDWVRHGRDSRYALPAEEVVARSAPRSRAAAQAAAAFELGQHLHRAGHPEAAVRWFRDSHRLAPDNWTYRRQAWTFANPAQGPSEDYDSDWLTDVRATGPENYYRLPRLD
jgi:hypothetical protein